jgi:hypothetical protein
MYWRCRYNLVSARRINDATSAQDIRNNAAVDRISEEMLKNLNRAKYSVLVKIEDDIELSDHKKCEAQGYNLGAVGFGSDDAYYRCRQNLILSRIPPAPKVTNSFEMTALPKQKSVEYMAIADISRTNKEANDVANLIQKYPNCLGLNVQSEDFKRCSAAANESERCLANVNFLQVKKELQDKIYCQNQAYIQFPDNYALAKEKSAKEISKLKLAQKDKDNIGEENIALQYLESDIDTKNIGRYVEDIANKEEQSKDKLYSRIELIKLRERFIYQCNKKMEDKLPDFNQKSSQDCLDIAKNWDKESK